MAEEETGLTTAGIIVRQRGIPISQVLIKLAIGTAKALVYLALIAGGVLTVFPFLWTISASFKDTSEMFSYPPSLIPPVFRFSNYADLFFASERVHFIRWYSNSGVVTSCSVVLSLFFSSMGGFGFAKYDFRFRGPLFAILLGSMMVPFHVVLIPLFVMMIRINWVNTYLALILPFSAGAFGIFLMRQYMVTIPTELMDAARIDGASDFRIYYQIFVPLCRPALATLTILGFMNSWNSFLWPLIILRTPEKFTLPLGMANLLGTWMGERLWGQVMAGSILSVLPVLVLFILMQKQFIAGMTLGAVRG